FPFSKGRVCRQSSSSAEVSRLQAAFSMPTRSAKCATAPPTAAIMRSSRERCRTVRECSLATAARQFHVTRFHAIGTVVQAVLAQLDPVEPRTDAAVLVTSAVALRFVALGTDDGLRRPI